MVCVIAVPIFAIQMLQTKSIWPLHQMANEVLEYDIMQLSIIQTMDDPCDV